MFILSVKCQLSKHLFFTVVNQSGHLRLEIDLVRLHFVIPSRAFNHKCLCLAIKRLSALLEQNRQNLVQLITNLLQITSLQLLYLLLYSVRCFVPQHLQLRVETREQIIEHLCNQFLLYFLKYYFVVLLSDIAKVACSFSQDIINSVLEIVNVALLAFLK